MLRARRNTGARHLTWALVACLASAKLSAQLPSRMPEGTRLFVTLVDSGGSRIPGSAGMLVGTLLRRGADTVYMRAIGADTIRVPRGSIRRLAVSQGTSRTKSALSQAFIYAVAFTSIGEMSAHSAGGDRARARVIGATIGLSTGAIVGALYPRERWRRISIDSL